MTSFNLIPTSTILFKTQSHSEVLRVNIYMNLRWRRKHNSVHDRNPGKSLLERRYLNEGLTELEEWDMQISEAKHPM